MPVLLHLLIVAAANEPWNASVIPGGATSGVKKQYLFLTSQIYYPSSGCFEFDVAIGARHATITLEVK